MFPGIETDVLGETGVITLDSSLYTEATIFRTAYWFTERYYVFLERSSPTSIKLELRSKPGQPNDLVTACAEFSNSLLDFRLRGIVSQETAGIREALVKQAFMQGIPKSGIEGAVSDERHLTNRPTQS